MQSHKNALVGRRLHTLDAMRGTAAFMVVLFHVAQAKNDFGFVPNSFLAVDFFFILSGLVIARAYEQPLKQSMTRKEFFIARLIRLYPLFILGLVLDFARRVIIVWQGKDYGYGYTDLLAAFSTEIFFIPSGRGEGSLLFLLNLPAWSLMIEVILNIVFALLLFRIKSLYLALISLVAFAFLAYSAFSSSTYSLGAYTYNFESGLLRGIFGFCVGILIGRIGLLRSFESWWVLAVLAALIGILVLQESFLHNTFILLIVMPLLVFVGSRVEPPAVLRKFFSLLGEASYPMYAVHISLIYSVSKMLGVVGIAAKFNFVLTGMVVFLVGLALTRFYDVPVRRILRKVSSRRVKVVTG